MLGQGHDSSAVTQGSGRSTPSSHKRNDDLQGNPQDLGETAGTEGRAALISQVMTASLDNWDVNVSVDAEVFGVSKVSFPPLCAVLDSHHMLDCTV